MDSLYLLALLACPVGMGLMMWFMMRGRAVGSTENPDQHNEVARLRAEVDSLRARDQHENRP
ncbi:hypothetical protein [Prauserella muralis]|uniref:Uncharacterized protein n=1 Tax=Prauserella muralis TaxID=588067 RepID=A0A2V4AVM4_9PSEU|nr:hypothetical protein [Prauserella muralis]PXY25387.1 hypothetical protein BAY60_18595 [Prauserella muralis]TWE27501.1 hypothetical protein FHX69_0135 [Prauserella muralis]